MRGECEAPLANSKSWHKDCYTSSGLSPLFGKNFCLVNKVGEVMKHSKVKGTFFAIAFMALLLALSVPVTSMGKDRNGKNRGRGDHDNQSWSKHNRKCGKFVNCHDARDGRWYGRGPRADRVGNNVWRNRNRNRFTYLKNSHLLNRRYIPRRIRVDN